jgi:hypothetical protein
MPGIFFRESCAPVSNGIATCDSHSESTNRKPAQVKPDLLTMEGTEEGNSYRRSHTCSRTISIQRVHLLLLDHVTQRLPMTLAGGFQVIDSATEMVERFMAGELKCRWCGQRNDCHHHLRVKAGLPHLIIVVFATANRRNRLWRLRVKCPNLNVDLSGAMACAQVIKMGQISFHQS